MALAVDDSVWAEDDDDDDAQIVRLAGAPGCDAFDLLYRRYADQVLRLCHARLGNAADADDACHETLLRAHRALPRFRAGAAMWPWLATIAAHVCIDAQRARRCDSLDAETGDWESTADTHTTVVSRLRHQLVGDALDELPTRYRSAVYLRDLEGWSYADIAELDGSSVAVVRGNLHRGRAALRERVRSLAERRGMWPLPAVVPGLPGLRLRERFRLYAGTMETALARADLTGLLAPVVPNLANAAIATAALAGLAMGASLGLGDEREGVPISAAAPVGGGELAGSFREIGVDDTEAVASGGAAGSSPDGSGEGDRQPVAMLEAEPVAPGSPRAAAITEVEREQGEPQRRVLATGEVESPDGETLASYELTFDCAYSEEREKTCDRADDSLAATDQLSGG